MITYQFITALSDAAPQSHLIASASCTHLPETALVAEMRESASIADTRFGCAPFARITLLPDALWQDSLTEGLLAALTAEYAPADLRGTAFGIVNLARGLMLLPASALAGALWTWYDPGTTFLAGAVAALLTGALAMAMHARRPSTAN